MASDDSKGKLYQKLPESQRRKMKNAFGIINKGTFRNPCDVWKKFRINNEEQVTKWNKQVKKFLRAYKRAETSQEQNRL